MNPRKFMMFGGLAAVLLVVIAGGAFWYAFLRDDAPEKVNLDSAVDSLSTPTSTSASATATATASATDDTTSGTPAAADGINGEWVKSTAGESFVGYRVKEELARVGFTTAVGRTTTLTADVTIADGKLVSGTIEADLTKLKSDQDFRDRALQGQGIETSKFPKATFVANGNVELPDGLESGEAVSISLPGKLTLHGVTRDVEIPVEAKLVDGRLVVVGSLPIVFSDYNVSKPSGASVLSIEDNGIMEFQIILESGGGSA